MALNLLSLELAQIQEMVKTAPIQKFLVGAQFYLIGKCKAAGDTPATSYQREEARLFCDYVLFLLSFCEYSDYFAPSEIRIDVLKQAGSFYCAHHHQTSSE